MSAALVREALEAAVKVLPSHVQMLDEAALNESGPSDSALAGEKCREALEALRAPTDRGAEAREAMEELDAAWAAVTLIAKDGCDVRVQAARHDRLEKARKLVRIPQPEARA